MTKMDTSLNFCTKLEKEADLILKYALASSITFSPIGAVSGYLGSKMLSALSTVDFSPKEAAFIGAIGFGMFGTVWAYVTRPETKSASEPNVIAPKSSIALAIELAKYPMFSGLIGAATTRLPVTSLQTSASTMQVAATFTIGFGAVQSIALASTAGYLIFKHHSFQSTPSVKNLSFFKPAQTHVEIMEQLEEEKRSICSLD